MNKVRARTRARYTPGVKSVTIEQSRPRLSSLQDGNPISFLLPPSGRGRGLDNLSCNLEGGVLFASEQGGI